MWGGERVVYAIVTLPKTGNGSRRLFFCTKNPESILLDYSRCENDAVRGYGEENVQSLPLACYSPRWNIETSYYESKTFWALEEYRVRSRGGIGQQIQASIIFSRFVGKLETVKKSCSLTKIIESYVLSGFKNVQKL